MPPPRRLAKFYYLAFLFVISVPRAWAEHPAPLPVPSETRIHGLSPERAAEIPGIEHLFSLHSASEPPTILEVRSLNGQAELDEIVGGLDYLLINSAHYDLVNMSWYHSLIHSYTLGLNALASAQVLMFTGSGNNGTTGGADLGYPSAHAATITMAATDDADAHAAFSNTGNSVDYSAPGVDIVAASFADPFSTNAFHQSDGTSFSSPMAAGTASLALSVRPGMEALELRTALKSTSVDLGSPGWDPEFGWGRINTEAAVRYLQDLLYLDGFETGDSSRWSSVAP